MNFYSDVILNDIIDNYPMDTLIDSIEKFGEGCFNKIARYSYNNIHHKYIYNVLGNTKNVVAFHCIDNEFNINNCPSILVYRKHRVNDHEIRYYILIACTQRKFRNQGYASKLIDGLVERIKNENRDNLQNTENTIKIILSSVEESVVFYETYGFKWTRQPITEHEMLTRYERYDPKKEYFIMEYTI
jgi:GNAT superfamily N-acetyltransferase